MIPTTREVVYALYGAWRLARLDRGGMAYFDPSVEGFWKSFFAAALVAPGYVILVLLDPVTLESGSGALRILVVHALTYSLSWTAYPVIVHPVCQAIGRGPAYTSFIVAFNWAKAIQIAVYLPVVAVVASELLPEAVGDLLHAGVYVLLLGYQWVVTRSALSTSALATSGLVALDFVISIVISVLAVGMIR